MIVLDSQSEAETWRPCGEMGPAQIGTGYIDGGRKNRQKENSATEDPIGRHVQDNSHEQSARTGHTTLTQHT